MAIHSQLGCEEPRTNRELRFVYAALLLVTGCVWPYWVLVADARRRWVFVTKGYGYSSVISLLCVITVYTVHGIRAHVKVVLKNFAG